ncbi:sigma 54-interacting transcriptional regulator, partial [Thermodesulfobacteriota bacterium]
SKKSLIRELNKLREKVNQLEATLGEERELAEESLVDAELRFGKLTEVSSDGVVVTKDGVIVEADERVGEITRRDPADLVGLRFEDLIPGEESTGILDRALSQGEDDSEVEIAAEDGSRIPVELSAKLASEDEIVAITALKDLRPIKEAERQVADTEERFQSVFDNSPDVIYLKDLDLKLTHVNPAMENLFGKKASELLGAAPEDLYGRQTAERIRKWDSRVLEGSIVEEEDTRTIDGHPYTFLDIRVPLRNATKDICGVCCISRDITDYKRTVPKASPGSGKYNSKAMRGMMAQATQIANTDGTILLLGESGSGKDYLARWIHDHSERASGPYFGLNCAALSPELAESELFGHEAGAFTGARGRKKGMLELAEGGTLLLNEIGELPLSLQSKLLTFLDTMSFIRVGGERPVTVEARLMAATHRDLAEEVREGRFLEPLYYRLNVFNLQVPSLRDRHEDIPLLLEEIMCELAEKMHILEIPVIDSSVLEGLAAYHWPGNVRELRNAVERALMLWDGGRFDLKLPSPPRTDENWTYDLPFPSYWTLKEVTDEVTKSMAIEALRRTRGNKKEAASILGVSRDALYRYIRRFKINPEMLA